MSLGTSGESNINLEMIQAGKDENFNAFQKMTYLQF